jgi:predicted site-specific integrase-resolvase
MQTDQLLRRKQVEELLNLSGESIRRLDRAGVLRPVLVGKRAIRYHAEDVRRLAREGLKPR